MLQRGKQGETSTNDWSQVDAMWANCPNYNRRHPQFTVLKQIMQNACIAWPVVHAYQQSFTHNNGRSHPFHGASHSQDLHGPISVKRDFVQNQHFAGMRSDQNQKLKAQCHRNRQTPQLDAIRKFDSISCMFLMLFTKSTIWWTCCEDLKKMYGGCFFLLAYGFRRYSAQIREKQKYGIT